MRFGAHVTQNNMAKLNYNQEWWLLEAMDKIPYLQMECCHKNVAWLLSAIQIGGNVVEFLGSFEAQKENLYFRG